MNIDDYDLFDERFSPDKWQSGVHAPTGKAVGVLASKGGIGKTTLTMWVAEAMSTVASVAVVDANFDNPTICYHTEWWGRTPGIGGLVDRQGGKPPTQQQIDDVIVPVEGLGDLLAGPQHPRKFDPKMAARTLCYVLGYLKTRYEWVFVDLPVAGTATTMITDFALRSNDLFDLYMAVFSTENSDIMSVSSWFWDQAKPPEQGGSNLDMKRCVGVINKSDANPMDHGVLSDQIRKRLHMNVAGHVPLDPNYSAAKNEREWGCPPELRQHVADFCHNAFGKSPWPNRAAAGASPSGQPANKKAGLRKWFGNRKARTID